MAGKVHLVGAGPGDPGLLTVRAAELLSRADVILHDGLVDRRLLALARRGAAVVEVAKTPGKQHPGQDAINERMIADARAGLEVVRLKGGDPFLFARGSEEAQALAAAGVDFDVVPGISSPVAAAAYAGIPLTHRDHASSVLILTGHGAADGAPPVEDLRRAAATPGTIVVLMGMRHLAALAAALREGGRPSDEPVAIVRWASSRLQQRTLITTLEHAARDAAAAGLAAPAVIIVGSVVSLHETLAWFEKLPLFGKRILVPRPVERSGTLERLLTEAGADVLEVPAIRIAPPPDAAAVRSALASLRDIDLVVFASANAVEGFFGAAADAGLDARCLGGKRVAAVGPATSEALRAVGIRADLVPSEYRGEALARALIAEGPVAGLRVLVPRALVASEALPAALRDAGAAVETVAVYETRPPDEDGLAALREAASCCDAVVLTSGSTAENLARALGPDGAALLAGRAILSIGPVTTHAAQVAGLEVTLTADEATMPGLVRALCKHFGGQSP